MFGFFTLLRSFTKEFPCLKSGPLNDHIGDRLRALEREIRCREKRACFARGHLQIADLTGRVCAVRERGNEITGCFDREVCARKCPADLCVDLLLYGKGFKSWHAGDLSCGLCDRTVGAVGLAPEACSFDRFEGLFCLCLCHCFACVFPCWHLFHQILIVVLYLYTRASLKYTRCADTE